MGMKSDWGSGGRWFESSHPDHFTKTPRPKESGPRPKGWFRNQDLELAWVSNDVAFRGLELRIPSPQQLCVRQIHFDVGNDAATFEDDALRCARLANWVDEQRVRWQLFYLAVENAAACLLSDHD